MKNSYKLYKSKDQTGVRFYIKKDNAEIDIKQLTLAHVILVGIANKIYNFSNLLLPEQSITSYCDLKTALELYEKNKEILPKDKFMKVVKALDPQEFFSRASEYAEMGNTSPLDIATRFAHTEEKACKEKVK